MADDNGPRADALAGLWVWMSLAFLPLLLLCLYLGRGAVLVAVVLPTAALGFSIASLVRVRANRAPLDGQGDAVLRVVLSAGTLALMTVFLLVVMPSWHLLVCKLDVENLRLALNMYAGDYGAFPPADRWCDRVMPYVQNDDDVFVCPERPRLRCGYAMNRALGNVRPEEVATDPAKTVLLFESDAGWNASGGIELLPKKPRHRGWDVYGYVGGTMDTEHPSMEAIPRTAAIGGTAGIFWGPKAGKR